MQNLSPFINYMHTLLCAVPPSFLNFSAWEHLSLLWQTSARFCSEGTKPIKPLSVMFIHQLSRSDCSLISELVMADSPMSVTWRHELRSSSWRLIRTVENRNTNSSDRVLQPFNTRTFKGTLWFVPCIKKKKDKKSMIKHFQYSTLLIGHKSRSNCREKLWNFDIKHHFLIKHLLKHISVR